MAASITPAGERSMRIPYFLAFLTALTLAPAAPFAQQPPAQPPAPGVPRPDYGAAISNEQAKAVAAAAIAEARKGGLRIAVTIVGPAGELVYFERMDGAQLASTELSRAKARTAVMFRIPSKAFFDNYRNGNLTYLTFPEPPIASEGGVPILLGGKIVGAIGISGGTSEQDGVVANTAANAAK
jgi:glc operon protein GlcG